MQPYGVIFMGPTPSWTHEVLAYKHGQDLLYTGGELPRLAQYHCGASCYGL
jgi:hypothetical protein